MSIGANMCACCKEIWNQDNLKAIRLGDHKLYLCPDCHKEFVGIVKKAYADGQDHPTRRFEERKEEICRDCQESIR